MKTHVLERASPEEDGCDDMAGLWLVEFDAVKAA
jgi:hypothetical protein